MAAGRGNLGIMQMTLWSCVDEERRRPGIRLPYAFTVHPLQEQTKSHYAACEGSM